MSPDASSFAATVSASPSINLRSAISAVTSINGCSLSTTDEHAASSSIQHGTLNLSGDEPEAVSLLSETALCGFFESTMSALSCTITAGSPLYRVFRTTAISHSKNG